MKIEQQFSEPEQVKDRQPYRIRIESKTGQSFDIVEQMDGGFTIWCSPQKNLVIWPVDINEIKLVVK